MPIVWVLADFELLPMGGKSVTLSDKIFSGVWDKSSHLSCKVLSQLISSWFKPLLEDFNEMRNSLTLFQPGRIPIQVNRQDSFLRLLMSSLCLVAAWWIQGTFIPLSQNLYIFIKHHLFAITPGIPLLDHHIACSFSPGEAAEPSLLPPWLWP